MTTNKIIIITIIISILIIFIPTTIKVINDHHDKLMLTVNKKAIEAYENCYYDNVCKDNKVTLKFLEDNNYIKDLEDKITKKIINKDSYVIKKEENNYELVIVD